MTTSITKEYEERLKAKRALRIQKKEQLEEAEAWMRDFQSQQSEATESLILLSSSEARRRRGHHKDRATFDMKRTLEVHVSMLQELKEEIEGIDAEIKELEDLTKPVADS
jgi:hypothetical protein